MVLFKINNVDFTAYINERTYVMDRKSEFESWVDGNLKTRRNIMRQRVKGSFTMTFLSETDYNAFESAIAAVMVNGDYVPVTVYVNNEKATANIDAFLDYTTRLVWTFESTRAPKIATLQVTVTER